jgi:hypothetical protein
MGYHGTPTCEINFENAVGYLVGREHKGMAHMFTFMNGARIGVSMMGVNAAEKSFQNALEYSKNRRAFRCIIPITAPSHSFPSERPREILTPLTLLILSLFILTYGRCCSHKKPLLKEVVQ